MSNIAAANIFLPSLACIGPTRHKNPLVVLTPVALCISLAFLFPISTPPNAIVLVNKNVTVQQMFRVGALCTVVFVTTTLTYCTLVLPYIYNVNSVSQEMLEECDV
jgi:sodium-dependent dicarboxylate transporter 2/3/5